MANNLEARLALKALVGMVDAFLAEIRHLSLVDADKVRDALLDFRLALTPSADE